MAKVPISIDSAGAAHPDNAKLKSDNDHAEWTSGRNFTIAFADGVDAPKTKQDGSNWVAKSKVFSKAEEGRHNYTITLVTSSGESIVVDPSIDVES